MSEQLNEKETYKNMPEEDLLEYTWHLLNSLQKIMDGADKPTAARLIGAACEEVKRLRRH